MSEAVQADRLAPLRARWRGLAVREQRLVVVAGLLLGAYLLWALAFAPAWRTLARAPAELDALERQYQQMQRLAAEVQQLRATPPVNTDLAAAAREALGTPAGR